MRQWNDLMVYPKLRPKLYPPPICSFCGQEIGVDEPERRVWPMSLTEDEQSRISFYFRLSKPEKEFGLCEKCFQVHCGGQYRKRGEPGRTEHIYETPDDWMDLLAQEYDAYRKRQPE